MKKTVFATVMLLASFTFAGRTEEQIKAIGNASATQRLQSMTADISKYGFNLYDIDIAGGSQPRGMTERISVYISYRFRNDLRSDLECELHFKMEKNAEDAVFYLAGTEEGDSYWNTCSGAIDKLRALAKKVDISDTWLIEMFAK